MILIRYAMLGFEFREKLLGIAALALLGLLRALADASVNVGAAAISSSRWYAPASWTMASALPFEHGEPLLLQIAPFRMPSPH
jgi:hypothetical protein